MEVYDLASSKGLRMAQIGIQDFQDIGNRKTIQEVRRAFEGALLQMRYKGSFKRAWRIRDIEILKGTAEECYYLIFRYEGACHCKYLPDLTNRTTTIIRNELNKAGDELEAIELAQE